MSNTLNEGRDAAHALGDLDFRANGFDSIRLLAAVAVIFSHAFPLTDFAEPLEVFSNDQASIGFLAVAIFFLTSGYLIPASFERGTIKRYVVNRTVRIMPALAIAVFICALVLGPLITSVQLIIYFTDPKSWGFLAHAIFLPADYALPGVFEGQPSQAVNGSLWSLKFEVACYVIVPLCLLWLRWRLAIVFLCWAASFVLARLIPDDAGGALFYIGLMAQLFRFFGTGMMLYLLRDQLPMRRSWATVASIICIASILTPFFVEAIAIFGSYAILYFAYFCPKWFRDLTENGDVSYGVYVYAFPIQQLLVPLSLTGIFGIAVQPWAINFLIATPLALLAGAISWILVEKPALQSVRKQKKKAPVA